MSLKNARPGHHRHQSGTHQPTRNVYRAPLCVCVCVFCCLHFCSSGCFLIYLLNAANFKTFFFHAPSPGRTHRAAFLQMGSTFSQYSLRNPEPSIFPGPAEGPLPGAAAPRCQWLPGGAQHGARLCAWGACSRGCLADKKCLLLTQRFHHGCLDLRFVFSRRCCECWIRAANPRAPGFLVPERHGVRSSSAGLTNARFSSVRC